MFDLYAISWDAIIPSSLDSNNDILKITINNNNIKT